MENLELAQIKLHKSYQELNQLEQDYVNRDKGQAFLSRYSQIRTKIKVAENNIKTFGNSAVVVKVVGRIRQDNGLLQQFQVIYTNLSTTDALEITKMKWLDIVSMEADYIETGILKKSKYVSRDPKQD